MIFAAGSPRAEGTIGEQFERRSVSHTMRAKPAIPRETRKVAHAIALLFAVLLSLIVHHVPLVARVPDAAHTITHVQAAFDYSERRCDPSHQTTLGCCATNMCLGAPPASAAGFLAVSHVIRHDPHGPAIALRWSNDGPDRPPKVFLMNADSNGMASMPCRLKPTRNHYHEHV